METGRTDVTQTVLAELRMTRGRSIQLMAVGTLGLLVGWALFSAVYQLGTGRPPGFQFVPPGAGWWTEAANVLVILVLGMGFVAPHEWLHGLAIRHYGGRPRYGVGVAHYVLPYAYASTDHEFSRNQFVVILLTPLVALTAIVVPVMLVFGWGWLVVPLATNAAGAVADVWMTLVVLGYPPHVRVIDHEAGMQILGGASDRPRSVSLTALVWNALSGAAVAAVGLAALLAVAGPVLLSMLGVESITVGTPGTITYLFSFTDSPTEISLGLGPGVLVVGAALGLTSAFLRSALGHPGPQTDA